VKSSGYKISTTSTAENKLCHKCLHTLSFQVTQFGLLFIQHHCKLQMNSIITVFQSHPRQQVPQMFTLVLLATNHKLSDFSPLSRFCLEQNFSHLSKFLVSIQNPSLMMHTLSSYVRRCTWHFILFFCRSVNWKCTMAKLMNNELPTWSLYLNSKCKSFKFNFTLNALISA